MSNHPFIQELEPRQLLATIAPDFSYGNRGVAPATTWMQIIGLQSDQKLIGIRRADENVRTIIDRRLPDGQLDSTFAFPQLGETELYASQAAIDGQDRIITVTTTRGEWNYINDRPTVRRFNADGTPDETFGIVRLPVPGKYDGVEVEQFWPRTMIVDSQDRILILYHTSYSPNGTNQPAVHRFYLDRLLPSGELDPTFGDGGRVLLATRPENSLSATELRVDSANQPRIAFGSYSSKAFVLGLDSTGKLDTDFADNGTLTIDSGTTSTYVGFDVDGADRLVVLLTSGQTVTGVRYLADGSLDSSFNASLTNAMFGSRALNARIDSTGRIVGTCGTAIFRLNPDGTADTTFDDDGVAKLGRDTVGQVLIADDGIYTRFTVGSQYGTVKMIEAPAAYLDPITHILHITGTADADNVSIRANGAQTRVVINTQLFAFLTTDIQEIHVQTYDGADNVAINLDRHAAIDLGAGDDGFTSNLGQFRIAAGDGNDTLLTAGGDDIIQTGAGNDVVNAGAGNDRILSAGGDDQLDGGDGDDLIRCASGANTLIGGLGRDDLRGGSGDDLINGNGGRDRLFGRGGNDTLFGGGNGDWLIGGEGNDLLQGGLGDDILVDLRETGDTVSVDVFDGGLGNDQGAYDDDDDVTSIESVLDDVI